MFPRKVCDQSDVGVLGTSGCKFIDWSSDLHLTPSPRTDDTGADQNRQTLSSQNGLAYFPFI